MASGRNGPPRRRWKHCADGAREAQDDESDKNPKSDPKRGGAGKGRRGKAAETPPADPPTTIKEAAKQSDAAIAEPWLFAEDEVDWPQVHRA